MLLSLDNDAVIHVLSHLTADELARFVCASHGTKSVGHREVCWASHVESISSQYATEESQFVVDEDAPAEPEYSGPRLRMPYLTPWTTAEVEKRRTAQDALRRRAEVLQALGVPVIPKSAEGWTFPRWRVANGRTEYRTYPVNEAKTCPAARTDVWVGATFPKSRCCGVEIRSLEDFEAHATSWRHYENNNYHPADAPLIAEYIDPRKVDGEAAFAALPKYEAYARMRRYVGNYKHELKRLDDEASPAHTIAYKRSLCTHLTSRAPRTVCRNSNAAVPPTPQVNWSESGRAQMESLADHARESFSGGYGPFSDTDSDEGPVEVDAKDVANAIVHSALDGFAEVGPYAELPGIPYSSAMDVWFLGLANCDPCGGSSSTQAFMETLHQFV